MEIEIVTAKQKLSKSLINQMQEATPMALKRGTVLGYMINVRKTEHKTILLKYDGQYYAISAEWYQGEKAAHRKVGKWTFQKTFDAPELLSNWWEDYTRALNEAVDQIYI